MIGSEHTPTGAAAIRIGELGPPVSTNTSAMSARDRATSPSDR